MNRPETRTTGQAGPPAPAAAADWRPAAQGWTLRLSGDWLADRLAPASPQPPAEPPGALPAGARVAVDAAALGRWDSSLAAWLWDLRGGLQARGATLDDTALPAGVRGLLALAAVRVASPRPPDGAAAGGRPPTDAAVTVAFIGEVLLALGRWLRGRGGVQAGEVLRQLDQTGPRSLPIVALSCALVGLMLAYMGGAQLDRIGAQGFVAGVVTVGMVRELAGLMAGIILAGRVGAAFAAELATMQANEEVDALRALGVDPIAHLVLPRLLALLLMGPALYVFGSVVGVLAGWPAAVLSYGVTSVEYLHQSLRALNFTHLSIGLFKAQLYVALVALAGCREGLHAGRSARAVGQATTAAVVKALVWIVSAACLTTVVFTALGF